MEQSDTVIVVEDSKTGWAKAYKELIAMLYTGQITKIDVNKVKSQVRQKLSAVVQPSATNSSKLI